MRRLAALALSFAMGACGAKAEPGDLAPLYATKDQALIAIDVESLTRKDDLLAVVYYHVPPQPRSVPGAEAAYTRYDSEIDCAGKRSRIVTADDLDERGNSLGRYPDPFGAGWVNDEGRAAGKIREAACTGVWPRSERFDGLSEARDFARRCARVREFVC